MANSNRKCKYCDRDIFYLISRHQKYCNAECRKKYAAESAKKKKLDSKIKSQSEGS